MVKDEKKPVVAIIGRPNVGKSTLFNRFVGSRLAIVDEMEGVTRDQIYADAEWEGNRYTVGDCGGIATESADPLFEVVSEKALDALGEADLVLFVVDVRAGVTAYDDLVKEKIWKAGKPAILVVNKVDSKKWEAELYEFYSLGFDDAETVAVSAASGRWFDKLLDLVNEKLGYVPPDESALTKAERKLAKSERRLKAGDFNERPPVNREKPIASEESPAVSGEVSLVDLIDSGETAFELTGLEEVEAPSLLAGSGETIRIALLGRQNVGKSSLANAFVEESRIIVTDMPGTTRDPIEIKFERVGRRFTVLDTAGLKRLSKVREPVDYYSMVRTSRRLPDTDVSILIVDAPEGIFEMDKLVAKKIGEAGKAVVVAVNKWDLVEDTEESRADYLDYVRDHFNKLSWANVLFISALKNAGLDELLESVVLAFEQHQKRVDNDVFREVLTEEIMLHPPPVMKNNPLKIFDMRQVAIRPPTFKLWINRRRSMHFSYKGFIENTIRSHFGFEGTIIRLIYEERRR